MSEKSGYLSDFYVEDDDLDYGAYQSALLDVLLKGATPLTVGVYGTWGSGKTSLMRMLKKEVDRQGSRKRAIWFTAWKYEHQDALWRAFILQVIAGLYPSDDNGVRLPLEKLDESQKAQVAQLEKLERSLYESATWQEKGEWTLDRTGLKKELVHLPFWLAFQLAGQGEAARDLGITPDLASTLERAIREHHLDQLQSMEQFANEFQKAVDLVLEKEGRLVIFVDDLDRCLPEKAVEILEAIKLFLDVPGTVFVLGMDREIVRRGVEVHYRSVMNLSPGEKGSEELPIDGDLYLQKIIQIPLFLPPLDVGGRKKFIEKQLEDLHVDYRLDPVTREVMARGLFPNPRQVKRALNVFNLLRQVAKKQEEQGNIPQGSISWPLLAKAVLIQSQWPDLYQKWRQYPRLIQLLEDRYTQVSYSEEDRDRGISFDPARKGKPSMASGTSETPAAAETGTEGGVAEEFLRNPSKYPLLFDMLRYPDPKDKNASQARFAGLSKDKMRLYIGLTASTESTPESDVETVSLSSQWRDFLASGDEVKINEVLADIEEKEQNKSGPLHQSARELLVGKLQTPTAPTRVRVVAGDGLARLGDPRFDPDFYFLPQKEDLCGFVHIPAGVFLMGSDKQKDSDASDAELPQHPVNLPDFFIQRYPVTVAQYRFFVKQSKYKTSDPDSLKGPANHPVMRVSWYDALAYTGWLTIQLQGTENTPAELRHPLQAGWRVTLPSETEWEKAARGMDGRIYPWGDDFDLDKANTNETNLGRTSAVGCFPGGHSPYDILDLSGNTWEWTRSLWGKDGRKTSFGYPYDPMDKKREDLKAGKDVMRVLRGGSWGNDRGRARVSYRDRYDPLSRDGSIGFRCVLSLPS